MPFSIRIITITILGMAAARPVTAANQWVAPCGNDAWAGQNSNCVAPLGPRRTIQAAIDAATDGDTVFLMPGTYVETIDLDGKAIRVVGVGGPELTTLDGGGIGPVVRCNSFETMGTVIEGVTITGGDSQAEGGGVLVGIASPRFIDCIVRDNHADGIGGGVASIFGSPSFTGCRFANNSSDEAGGGIAISLGLATLVGCTIDGNLSDGPGGGIAILEATATLVDTDIFFNDAIDGGGLVAIDASVTVDDAWIHANTAQLHGGGIQIRGGSLELIDATLDSNEAQFAGGGAALEFGATASFDTVQITGCEVPGDMFPPATGGGLFLHEATLDATTGVFVSCRGGAGAGIFARESVMHFEVYTFSDNVAVQTGGAVALVGDGSMHVERAHFLDNAADIGGAIHHVDGAALHVDEVLFEHNDAGIGGAISCDNAAIFVRDSAFEDNDSAFLGGAVEIQYVNPLIARFTNTGFLRNEAHDEGGAVMLFRSGAAFESCTFIENEARVGGAVRARSTTAFRRILEMDDVLLQSNVATESGGGIAAADPMDVRLSRVRFWNNHAGTRGGGVHLENEADAAVVSADFQSNTAAEGAAIALEPATELRLHDALLTQNGAVERGGALFCIAGPGVARPRATLVNVTASLNSAGLGGAIATLGPASIRIDNSILWNNGPAPEIDALESPIIRWSIAPPPMLGPGVLVADPLFVDPVSNDWRLAPGSPAIDAGSNWLLPRDETDLDDDGDADETLPLDRLGQARVMTGADVGCPFGRVDLGAFEVFGASSDVVIADLNGDGVVDASDLAMVLGSWGEPDECAALDLDGDGTVGAGDLTILLGAWS